MSNIISNVNKNVKIIDIAKENGIILIDASSNSFNYVCRCPSVNHKNGTEKTPSCYIDSINNNFYCFGCNANNSAIHFYMLVKDISFGEALRELSQKYHIDDYTSEVKIENLTQPNIFSVLLDISKNFRKIMLENPDDLKWINSVMKKTDQFIDELQQDDVQSAKNLKNDLNSLFDKRYKP